MTGDRETSTVLLLYTHLLAQTLVIFTIRPSIKMSIRNIRPLPFKNHLYYTH